MKILIIQEKGRHKENENFREALNLQRALLRQDVNCIVWGLGYDNFSIPFDEISKDCDIILLLENYEVNGWIPNLSSCNKLKVFWSIDSHCALNAHINTCDKHNIDVVLNSTNSFVNNFIKPGRTCYWFPNAYPSDLIQPIFFPKNINIGFCGNANNRQSWITQLQQSHSLKFDSFVIGTNMVDIINKYKIHWNRNIGVDINYRTFETLGCKTFLMTNDTDRLSDLFDIGKHLVTYTDLNDCREKIDYFLKNDMERIEIEENGYEHVLKYHTYDNRATRLIEILKENL